MIHLMLLFHVIVSEANNARNTIMPVMQVSASNESNAIVSPVSQVMQEARRICELAFELFNLMSTRT